MTSHSISPGSQNAFLQDGLWTKTSEKVLLSLFISTRLLSVVLRDISKLEWKFLCLNLNNMQHWKDINESFVFLGVRRSFNFDLDRSYKDAKCDYIRKINRFICRLTIPTSNNIWKLQCIIAHHWHSHQINYLMSIAMDNRPQVQSGFQAGASGPHKILFKNRNTWLHTIINKAQIYLDNTDRAFVIDWEVSASLEKIYHFIKRVNLQYTTNVTSCLLIMYQKT